MNVDITYIYTYRYVIHTMYTYIPTCSACINQGVFLLSINPMLICVPCRFGYQFISMFSSLFFVYLFIFCLPNKLYIIIYLHITGIRLYISLTLLESYLTNTLFRKKQRNIMYVYVVYIISNNLLLTIYVVNRLHINC